ncbi:bis(5'-nucleosyl)-tetraphosphatase (symmetrical) YqeK [Vagococcus elongatus]|uniref:bis(5'-nucleosyl)-tetraphosphatase (symmetrical) YqeK n=1 Tax=Vagococcus elongatus TaxID=180344 RepID=UPI003CCC7788
MLYSKQYFPGTREELVKKVSATMSPKRFSHVLRVEKVALELAEYYGEELEKTSVAALVHDYAKERPDEDFIRQIDKGKYSQDLKAYGNEIWHGIIGADFVAEELEISDEAILQAVRLHTTGAKEMSRLAQIIYVADFIEDGRDFPGVATARRLAFENLASAVAFETKHTLQFLIEKEVKVYPKTIETYNAWVAN